MARRLRATQPVTHDDIFERFVNGRLSKSEWTHEAHLITCWVTLQDRTPPETVDFLRAAITAHNCGVGTVNSDTSGYHETLTAYYVAAVAAANAATPEQLNDVASCSRVGPLEHWTRERLYSTEARLGWLDPDRKPLPADMWDLLAGYHPGEAA